MKPLGAAMLWYVKYSSPPYSISTITLRRSTPATVRPYGAVTFSKTQLNPLKSLPRTKLTGRMRNQPSTPPATAPGREARPVAAYGNHFGASSYSGESAAGSPSKEAAYDLPSQTVAVAPNSAKDHQGSASRFIS